MYKFTMWCALSIGCLAAGCSQTTTPQATTGDEVSAYLEAHPELKEKQADPGLSDPTK